MGNQILLVMTMFHADLSQFRRQLALFAPSRSEDLFKRMKKHLNTFDLDPEELKLSNRIGDDSVAFFEVNTLYSRKLLSPILSKFLQEQ